MHLGAKHSANPFSVSATRNHANVFANPLVALLAVFEHSPLCEAVMLTSILFTVLPQSEHTVLSITEWAYLSLPKTELPA